MDFGVISLKLDASYNGGEINGENTLDAKMLADVMNSSDSGVLRTDRDAMKYANGFWLLDLSTNPNFAYCFESGSDLIPFMSGYGGIRIFLLPNGTIYYYISDNYEFAGLEGIIESNKIRSFCK